MGEQEGRLTHNSLTGFPCMHKIVIAVTNDGTPNLEVKSGPGEITTGVNPRLARGRVNLSTRTRQLTSAAAERATPGQLVKGFFSLF